MVNAVKRWLGIEALERENLVLARALAKHGERISELEAQKPLTNAPEIKNIETKPPTLKRKRVNWMQARQALENSKGFPQEEF